MTAPLTRTTPRIVPLVRIEAAYWLLVAVLVIAQAAYTIAGADRLWYEEAAEGIRNPYWLDHRLVYDGVSSNVGWYGLVLVAYKAFGFSTSMAKYVRLALHVPFLICSAALLKRWIGPARAWLPLLAIALSPTILYFNSLGTSYGIDVQLFPIVLYLIVRVGDRARAGRMRLAVLQFSIGWLAMFGCLAFPSFLVYVPVLLAFYLWNHRGTFAPARLVTGLVWIAAGFEAPLAAALLYLKNDAAFLSDPQARGAGVFRGGGSAVTLDWHNVQQAVSRVLQDLWLGANSYYFGIPQVEFSGALGVFAAVGILLGSIVAWRAMRSRAPLVLAGLLCLLAVIAPAFAGGLPGLRRSTGFLSGFYIVMVCVWAMATSQSGGHRIVGWAVRLACVLLVVHHISSYSANYRSLASVDGRGNGEWFQEFGSPDESIRRWAHDWTLNGRPLNCNVFPICRYSEIYSAIAGYLKWNGMGEPPLLAIEPGTTRIIELTPRYWEARFLDH